MLKGLYQIKIVCWQNCLWSFNIYTFFLIFILFLLERRRADDSWRLYDPRKLQTRFIFKYFAIFSISLPFKSFSLKFDYRWFLSLKIFIYIERGRRYQNVKSNMGVDWVLVSFSLIWLCLICVENGGNGISLISVFVFHRFFVEGIHLWMKYREMGWVWTVGWLWTANFRYYKTFFWIKIQLPDQIGSSSAHFLKIMNCNILKVLLNVTSSIQRHPVSQYVIFHHNWKNLTILEVFLIQKSIKIPPLFIGHLIHKKVIKLFLVRHLQNQ